MAFFNKLKIVIFARELWFKCNTDISTCWYWKILSHQHGIDYFPVLTTCANICKGKEINNAAHEERFHVNKCPLL